MNFGKWEDTLPKATREHYWESWGRGSIPPDIDERPARFCESARIAGTGLVWQPRLVDGEIVVKSPPAGTFKGSEFTVSLPVKKITATEGAMQYDVRKQPYAPVVAKPDLSEWIPAKDEKNTGTPLILLVEDNADVVAYTASCLFDYRLAVGKDGREGFDIATDMIPDLIITDVMMPFVDGFELVNKLRQGDPPTQPVMIPDKTGKRIITGSVQ